MRSYCYSTGKYIQYAVINLNGKEYEKGYLSIYLSVYVYLNHFAVQQKLTQYCK